MTDAVQPNRRLIMTDDSRNEAELGLASLAMARPASRWRGRQESGAMG